MKPQTLFAIAGREPEIARFPDASLILIDFQNEYTDGPLALAGASAAIRKALLLIEAARASGSKIIHVAHSGAPGGLFDRSAWRGLIIDALQPAKGELVIEKPRPNSFSGTALADHAGKSAVIAGFMTHMCVSSTARAALDLGIAVTIAADACATRDLPDAESGIVSAADLNRAELAALSDRFARIASVSEIGAAVR